MESRTGEPRERSPVGFLLQHWRALGRGALALILLVIVLQNVEPTTVDLWFWSVASVPKLVLILVSMAIGAALWEVARRGLRGRRRMRQGDGSQ